MKPARRRRGIALFSALLLASAAGVSTATASPVIPSESEIADSWSQVDSTAGRIADLEVRLARQATDLEAAEQAAAIASEAYNQAAVDLEDAEADALTAAEDATRADEEVSLASDEVARLAMAAYRNQGLGHLEVLTTADGLDDMLNRATTFERLGGQATDALQRLEAAELVAALMHERAEEAVATAEQAAQTLQDRFAEAEAAFDSAEQAHESTATERGALIGELAELRDTTVALEQQRQDGLEQQRLERENAAALARQQELERQEAERQERQERDREPAERTGPQRPESTPSPSSTPTPSQSPTSRPSPSPSPSPSQPPRADSPPPPTSTPSPRPTPTPTQTPTPRPTPTPTPPPPPPPPPPPSGGGSSAGVGQSAVNWALAQVGKPYIWGAAGPHGFDCSGLTQKAYQAAGRNLPRTTRDQYAAIAKVPTSQMRPGDLVFYSNNGQASGVYHVAIYTGNGMRVHAPSPGKNVEHVPMWWANVLPMAGRP